MRDVFSVGAHQALRIRGAVRPLPVQLHRQLVATARSELAGAQRADVVIDQLLRALLLVPLAAAMPHLRAEAVCDVLRAVPPEDAEVQPVVSEPGSGPHTASNTSTTPCGGRQCKRE